MSRPSDYLAVIYLRVSYPFTQNSIPLPDSFESAHDLLEEYFKKSFDPVYTRMAINKLENWGFLEIVSDPYAGDLIISDNSGIASPNTQLSHVGMSGLMNAAVNGGDAWMARVLSNGEFWTNFAEESENSGDKAAEELEYKGEIPASDRLVRLDHNQASELDHPIIELIELVEPENSIGEDEGLRELVLGKLRAGRELIRAGVFSLASLHLTLVVGLQMLVERHKDTAIAVASAKLLDLLLKEYGIG